MMAIFGALLPRFLLLVGWSNDPAGWGSVLGSPVWFLFGFISGCEAKSSFEQLGFAKFERR